jgi:hypothetical protein
VVVAPDGREHRLPVAARDDPVVCHIADRRHPKLGAVPRHPRMIPADPGQPGAIRRRGREGEEVRTAHQYPDGVGIGGGRPVQRHGHDRSGDPAAAVPFPYAPHLGAVRGQHEVGEPVGRVIVGRRRQRARLAGFRSVPGAIKPLVGEVREDEAIRQRQEGLAAVFVHAGPGVPRHGE